ncbi:unnamed protein product [Schistosoma curassoni]|uniref:PLAT domain-containing protein n=1 Tax=Schistosoma curassoni TaxID=6186 RepID=A0A183K3H3_9TREM|nr:unnamed protein product [Schistosoma curassoni]
MSGIVPFYLFVFPYSVLQWIPSVLSIENLTKSFHLAIGEEFIMVVDYGFLGTMSYVAQILSIEPNTSFTFILDDWLETRFDFSFTSIDQEKSRMKLTISSNKNNMFYKVSHTILASNFYVNNVTTSIYLSSQTSRNKMSWVCAASQFYSVSSLAILHQL